MKKIYLSMMAMAIAAFTFTSCEDVPEPYNNPYDQIKPSEPEVVIEPAGEGTQESPWNVAAVIEACSGLNDGDFLNDGAEVYVTGIVTETTDISTQYKNATYYISDNAKASNKFYVFRGKLLNNADVTAETDIEVGDSVTVCGKIKNYKGTMEFDQNNYLVYYKKGEGGGETPDAPGTLEAPLTVAEALAYIDANLEADKQSPVGYVKGKIAAISEIDTGQYGNATYTISDDGSENNTLQIYRGYGLGGAKFTNANDIKVGDNVIVSGKLVNFKGNTKQFAQGSKIMQLNDKKAEGGDTPSGEGEGKGTADSPYNVTAAIAAGSGTGVYVKAYIVGSVDGQVLATGATFSATSNTQTNILIAASADETDVNKCMPVQLPAGAIRTGLNLKDNAGNYKKEVTLYGNIEKYFGATGIKSVSFAILNGTEIGTNPAGGGGGDTPSGDVKTVTVAEFNAAAESTDVWYKLTGTIRNLKDGDQYGNFDLEDATGSVYVYGLLSEKGGEKKKFQELVEKYGLANGSTVTIIGNRGSYNGKIEVMNAYIVVEGNGGGDTPGGSGTGADGSTIISVADFNAAAESTDVWYQLTGTISNLKDGDQYGNFDLEDATGSVYVYGVLSEKGGAKKKFQELVAEKGIANGKKITIVGNRGSYNGKIEVMNAYFIKVE
jgi:RPA family protein